MTMTSENKQWYATLWERHPKRMENIMKASMVGDLRRACYLGTQLVEFQGQKCDFNRFVGIFFSPCCEQGSTAFSSAALNGHRKLCETYVVMLVLVFFRSNSNSRQRKLVYGGRGSSGITGPGNFLCHTLREWAAVVECFDQLSGVENWQPRSHRSRRYTVPDLILHASQQLNGTRASPYYEEFAIELRRINWNRPKRHKVLPQLNTDDDVDCLTDTDDVVENEEDLIPSLIQDDNVLEGCKSQLTEHTATTTMAEPIDDATKSFCSGSDSSDSSLSSLQILHSPSDVLSDDDLDSSSVVVADHSDANSDWEMLSDVASVVSLASTVAFSYRDALVSGAHQVQEADNKGRENTFQPELVSIREHECSSEPVTEDLFDAYFVMEGLKGARGGKSKLMFKGNSKQGLPRSKGKRRG